MFTVKWIADNGSEQLVDTLEVNYTPKHVMELPPEGDGVVTFYHSDEDGAFTRLDTGKVYVMNSSGATVAFYWLS